MDQKSVKVSPEEYEAAGGDPKLCKTLTDNPDLEATLKQVGADHETPEESSASLTDFKENFKINGHPCRPFSLQIITWLEVVNHPLLDDGKADDEMNMNEMAILIYFLTFPEDEDIEDAIEDKKLARQARSWSKQFDMEFFKNAQAELGTWMDEAGEEMAGLGQGSGDKKKGTGS